MAAVKSLNSQSFWTTLGFWGLHDRTWKDTKEFLANEAHRAQLENELTSCQLVSGRFMALGYILAVLFLNLIFFSFNLILLFYIPTPHFIFNYVIALLAGILIYFLAESTMENVKTPLINLAIISLPLWIPHLVIYFVLILGHAIYTAFRFIGRIVKTVFTRLILRPLHSRFDRPIRFIK
ncbi:TPA: hypothetical protein DF272_04625 [Candidatus Falkowbacteria bacterium]|nr:hypothetical protein [Candidatus Falkowbacteria bacterium]